MAKMHENEVPIDADLVRRLLAGQLPEWADLPLAPVESSGTDHTLYRLGDDMVVRLPRVEWAVPQAEKEHRWLPVLAPSLPLTIPTQLALCEPAEGYPWRWSVYRWLPGETASYDVLAGSREAAADMAAFVVALHSIDTEGGPLHGEHNFGRGEPLANRDEGTRRWLADCEGLVDTAALTRVWDEALDAPLWDGPGVWVHGDLAPGNLLVRNGRITAVIDFGGLGVGDPAVDLLVAWSLFDAKARKVFREGVGVDDATWARGRGWVASTTVGVLSYYLHTNPAMVATARRSIAAVLAG